MSSIRQKYNLVIRNEITRVYIIEPACLYHCRGVLDFVCSTDPIVFLHSSMDNVKPSIFPTARCFSEYRLVFSCLEPLPARWPIVTYQPLANWFPLRSSSQSSIFVSYYLTSPCTVRFAFTTPSPAHTLTSGVILMVIWVCLWLLCVCLERIIPRI